MNWSNSSPMRSHSRCTASDTFLYSYHKAPEKWFEDLYIITSLLRFRDEIYIFHPKESIIGEMSPFYTECDTWISIARPLFPTTPWENDSLGGQIICANPYQRPSHLSMKPKNRKALEKWCNRNKPFPFLSNLIFCAYVVLLTNTASEVHVRTA